MAEKSRIISIITNTSATITTNAKKIFSAPKNMSDHVAFKARWSAKNPYARLSIVFFLPDMFLVWLSRISRKRESPIRRYNVVQTGPNIQFGGLKKGLVRVVYHVVIFGNVYKLPIKPGKKERSTVPISKI